MQQLTGLEESLAKLFKDVPHLPKGLRVWLVDNAWWLTIIGVILGVFGILATIPAMILGSAVITMYAGGAYGGTVFMSGLVSLVVLVATVIVEAKAIQPLKLKQKRGWDLLFLAALIGIAGMLLNAVVANNIVGGLLGAAIGAAISFYILFELRGHYGGTAKVVKEAKVVPQPPKSTK